MATVPLKSAREKTYQGIILTSEPQWEKVSDAEQNNPCYFLSHGPLLFYLHCHHSWIPVLAQPGLEGSSGNSLAPSGSCDPEFSSAYYQAHAFPPFSGCAGSDFPHLQNGDG